jgi:hypothetical protein
MAADLIHPDDRPHPAARFRAHLASYLRGLPAPELAELLAGLPDPVTVDLIANSPPAARPRPAPRHLARPPRHRAAAAAVAAGGGGRPARRPRCPPRRRTTRRHPGRLGRQPPLGHPARQGPGGRAAARRGAAWSRERDDLAAMAFDDPAARAARARAAHPGLAGLVAARRALTGFGLAWSPGRFGPGFRFSAQGCSRRVEGVSHLGCSTSGPKLPMSCGGRCSPSLNQAVEQGGCRSPIPRCISASRGVAASSVSIP